MQMTCQSKIPQLNQNTISFFSHENIPRLNVMVDNAFRVNIVQACKNQLLLDHANLIGANVPNLSTAESVLGGWYQSIQDGRSSEQAPISS